MCDLFASFFESVYDKNVADGIHEEVNSETFYEGDGANPFPFSITREDVVTALLLFDDCKVSTPDGVPMIFFKKLKGVISEPLVMLFNKSLSAGKFATYWKLSHVTPIFKSGKKADIKNYRPISIMCAIKKCFGKDCSSQNVQFS